MTERELERLLEEEPDERRVEKAISEWLGKRVG